MVNVSALHKELVALDKKNLHTSYVELYNPYHLDRRSVILNSVRSSFYSVIIRYNFT